MASVQITAFDIAQLLGLRYFGEEWNENTCMYEYKFKLHGKEIVDDLWHETEEDAKNATAQDLLRQLGKHLATIIE